ncbi:MAG TPA: hypothetical protein VHB45_04080 [Alloacidobacterium sp.]|nr:hypothetical protein [Alloacidobacterium sp.]
MASKCSGTGNKDMEKNKKSADSKREEGKKQGREGIIRTSLLILGSAVFGGIAVVLWNRRALTNIQNPPPQSGQESISADSDAIY